MKSKKSKTVTAKIHRGVSGGKKEFSPRIKSPSKVQIRKGVVVYDLPDLEMKRFVFSTEGMEKKRMSARRSLMDAECAIKNELKSKG